MKIKCYSVCVYIYGILLNINKKEGNLAICGNTDGPWRRYAYCNETGKQIMYDRSNHLHLFIYVYKLFIVLSMCHIKNRWDALNTAQTVWISRNVYNPKPWREALWERRNLGYERICPQRKWRKSLLFMFSIHGCKGHIKWRVESFFTTQ